MIGFHLVQLFRLLMLLGDGVVVGAASGLALGLMVAAVVSRR